MMPVLESAVKHVQGLGPRLDSSYPAEDALMEITVLSSDAVQGDTWEAAVLAVPSDCNTWSPWLKCPRWCVMTLSRHYRQLATLSLTNGSGSQDPAVNAIAKFQQKAARVLTWEMIAAHLDIASVTVSGGIHGK